VVYNMPECSVEALNDYEGGFEVVDFLDMAVEALDDAEVLAYFPDIDDGEALAWYLERGGDMENLLSLLHEQGEEMSDVWDAFVCDCRYGSRADQLKDRIADDKWKQGG